MPTSPTLPTDAPLPVYSEPPINGAPGTFSTAWYKWFTIVARLLTELKSNFPGQIVAEDVDVLEEIVGEIAFPADGTYTIILESKYAKTILEVTAKTSAGSTTLTPEINSTPLGGGANSVTTSKGTVSHSTANAMIAGDKLIFVLSGTSGDCTNLSFSVKYTRKITMLQYA
jgi:hypothetical protein